MTEQNTTPTTSSAADNTRRRKTMSPSALAANRANAQKSTGPRTPSGKLRSASNALQHGLYSLGNFEHFAQNHDVALEVVTNLLIQLKPVTPSEHLLAHQLIHMQLRFLQMEFLYNESMNASVHDVMTAPPAFLTQVLRELDRLPSRIQRTLKAFHAEQARRLSQDPAQIEKLEIKPIEDQDPLPALNNNAPEAGHPQEYPHIDPHELFRIFAGRIVARCQDEGVALPELVTDESNPSIPIG